jgi:hypothetical protein
VRASGGLLERDGVVASAAELVSRVYSHVDVSHRPGLRETMLRSSGNACGTVFDLGFSGHTRLAPCSASTGRPGTHPSPRNPETGPYSKQTCRTTTVQVGASMNHRG